MTAARIAAVMFALLAACPAARAWQARIAATDADVASLLDLAADLAAHEGLERATVERALGVRLVERERGDAFAFFEAADVPLGALRLTHVGYRESLPGGSATAGALLALDVEGPCLDRRRIEARFGPLVLTESPRGRSAEERAVWSRVLADRTLGFGFAEREPDCLGSVSLAFRSPAGERNRREPH